MVCQERPARRFVRRFERAKVGIERNLCVDHDALPARQAHDHVRPHPPILVGQRVLLLEIAMLDHASELDDAFEVELAPTAADAWLLERVGQPLIRFLKASSPCRNHSQQMKRLEVLGIGVEHEPAKTLCLNQLSALKKCDGVAHRLFHSKRSCTRLWALPGLGVWGKHV